MDGEEYKDLQTILPVINTAAAANKLAKVRQCVIAVTGSSARTNVAALIPELAPGGALDGQYFDFTADGCNVYLFCNNEDAGTADPTATGAGVTVCGGVIFNGQKVPFKFPSNYTWLVAIGSTTGNLRIALSSLSYNQIVGDLNGNA